MSLFVTFEGGEASGKSTQLRRLADKLAGQGHRVTTTREPGGSPAAEAIRDLMLDAGLPLVRRAAILLAFAARADHLATTVLPALDDGQIVLCDRFADSTMVYQGLADGAPKADLQLIETLTRQIERLPDLTLVLDLDAESGARRLAARGGRPDRFEQRGADFHEHVREGFRSVAAREPGRCVLIDAAGSEEEVHVRVMRAVAPRLPASADAAAAAR